MKIQTGIDLCSIERIEQSLRSPRFIDRVFSHAEQALIDNRGIVFRASTAAANFAAKEAFGKAMGTGIRGFSLSEVEILRDMLGKPILNLTGQAKLLALKQGFTSFSVSLSHEREMATAIVIAYAE